MGLRQLADDTKLGSIKEVGSLQNDPLLEGTCNTQLGRVVEEESLQHLSD